MCLTEPLTSDPLPAAQGGWETPPGLHCQGWGGPCDPSVNPSRPCSTASDLTLGSCRRFKPATHTGKSGGLGPGITHRDSIQQLRTGKRPGGTSSRGRSGGGPRACGRPDAGRCPSHRGAVLGVSASTRVVNPASRVLGGKSARSLSIP